MIFSVPYAVWLTLFSFDKKSIGGRETDNSQRANLVKYIKTQLDTLFYSTLSIFALRYVYNTNSAIVMLVRRLPSHSTNCEHTAPGYTRSLFVLIGSYSSTHYESVVYPGYRS